MGSVIDTVVVSGHTYRLERADAADVAALVSLLADDPLGMTRESKDLTAYLAAFEEIDADPNQLLLAVRNEADGVTATMQLTLIPGLSRGGSKRLQIEGVRVGAGARGSGLGRVLLAWAHEHGQRHGATLAQLTSDKARGDAHRFYEQIGYAASHEGFKLTL